MEARGDIKWETEAQAISLNLFTIFAHCANGSLSFVCLLQRNKQKLSVGKRTKQAKWTCLSIFGTYSVCILTGFIRVVTAGSVRENRSAASAEVVAVG